MTLFFTENHNYTLVIFNVDAVKVVVLHSLTWVNALVFFSFHTTGSWWQIAKSGSSCIVGSLARIYAPWQSLATWHRLTYSPPWPPPTLIMALPTSLQAHLMPCSSIGIHPVPTQPGVNFCLMPLLCILSDYSFWDSPTAPGPSSYPCQMELRSILWAWEHSSSVCSLHCAFVLQWLWETIQNQQGLVQPLPVCACIQRPHFGVGNHEQLVHIVYPSP